MYGRDVLRYSGAFLALVCMLGLVGAAANADIPDVVLEIEATASDTGETANVQIMSEWGTIDPDTQTWSYDMPAILLLIGENSTILGQIDDLSIAIAQDPEVNLTFSVQAGTVDTTFRIASSLMTFPTLSSPDGRASAGYTVTDFNGNGATLTGIGETGGAYLAKYNGWAGSIPPGGTTFTEDLALISAGVFGSNTEDFEDPVGGGYRAIGEPVSSISSLAYFSLTASDLASGTSSFEVVPEPGAFALLAVGWMALLRRCR
jgi:hypothetical protein